MRFISWVHPHRIPVVIVVLTTLLAAAAFSRTVHATSSGPALASVPPGRLTWEGMRLDQPQHSAIVGAATAAQAATSRFGRARVREEVLAEVRDTHVPAVDGKLCWIVSVMPAGGLWFPSGPPSSKPSQARFLLVFIDAQTGAFLLGDMG